MTVDTTGTGTVSFGVSRVPQGQAPCLSVTAEYRRICTVSLGYSRVPQGQVHNVLRGC